MDLIPKSVLRALDTLEGSLDEFETALTELSKDDTAETNAATRAQRDIALALAINGLMVMLKRAKGEDVEESLVQFEKCKKAAEKFNEKPDSNKPARVDPKPSGNKKRDSSAISSNSNPAASSGKAQGPSSSKKKVKS